MNGAPVEGPGVDEVEGGDHGGRLRVVVEELVHRAANGEETLGTRGHLSGGVGRGLGIFCCMHLTYLF